MTFTSPRSQLPLGIATQPENFAESDRLGEEYCASNPASARRAEGITLTPDRVVQFMVRRLARNGSQFKRVVDAGAGTGRFAIAAAEAFPHAEIIAVERNHGLAAILRNNLAAAGLSQRITVLERDYCAVAFAAIDAPTLYLGNPHSSPGRDEQAPIRATLRGTASHGTAWACAIRRRSS